MDKAWEQLGDLRLIPVTLDEVTAAGKVPEDVVKFPSSFGLGEEAYAGRLSVFHQIHCLDAVRREAYAQHYYPDGVNDTTGMHRLHLSHCIHYLLQNILCQANTDIYTHIWTDAQATAWPDFNVNAQCRDFDAVKSWHKKNAVDLKSFDNLRAPSGAKIHRMSREFKKVLGYFESHEDIGDHGSEIG